MGSERLSTQMQVLFRGCLKITKAVDWENMRGKKCEVGFGLVERVSLDVIIVQVLSNRSTDVLLPIIHKNCVDGTVFRSDGWKVYHKLKEHLQLEDCLHFAVNHSENYVDPTTGAYTQTVEGMWNPCKTFLP